MAAPKRPQVVERPRRIPTQARSRDTLEVIFEATARILERDGRAGLNTNAIAARAGVSIGTLYHYFSGKDAILIAMARRELEQHRGAVAKALCGPPAETRAEPDRAIVRALIEVFGSRLAARRIATETLIARDLGHELAGPVEAAAQLLTENATRVFGEAARPLTAEAAFVLTRAVSGVLNAAVREGSPFYATPALEDELVRLIRSFVAA